MSEKKKSLQVYQEDWRQLIELKLRDGDGSLADTVKKLLGGTP